MASDEEKQNKTPAVEHGLPNGLFDEDQFEDLYTVQELEHLACITKSQVRHWTETIGLIVTAYRVPEPRPGENAAFYSWQEVLHASIISEMKRRGLSASLKITTIAPKLRQKAGYLSEPNRDRRLASYLSDPNRDRFVITDGYAVQFASNPEEVISILKNRKGLVLLVDIAGKADELKQHRDPSRKRKSLKKTNQKPSSASEIGGLVLPLDE